MFNAKQHKNDVKMTCKKCGTETSYKIAYNGCPSCGHHLLKLGSRSGTPVAWDKDRIDPYQRQKQKDGPQSDGSGYKLTAPGEGSGYGTRFRGTGGPTGFSESADEQEDTDRKDIPSEETNLDQPPTEGTPQLGWFADPEDALSATQDMNRQMSNHDAVPFDKQLSIQRTDNSLKGRLNDSIFGRTITKLKGVQR